jgi:hypothetical protein
MDQEVTDSSLIDVRGLDPSKLFTEVDNDSSLKNALDRLLDSDQGACHGFSSRI